MEVLYVDVAIVVTAIGLKLMTTKLLIEVKALRGLADHAD